MNDRELLELAARSIGLEHEGYTENFFDPECCGSIGLVVSHGGVAWIWNPLADDGDAFRLMVGLGLRVDRVINGISIISGDGIRVLSEVFWRGGKSGTYRRAIVMAAAEIGKSK